jgi:hypothetical protein
MGTFDAAMLTGFRMLVKLVTAAETADDEPATARARLAQSAQAALAAWGLRPADRDRVSPAPEPRDPEEDRIAEFLR